MVPLNRLADDVTNFQAMRFCPMSALSLNKVIEKTKRLPGAESVDFSYITEDLIASDANATHVEFLGREAALTTYYGNNARYGAWTDGNGTTWQGYYFDWAPNDACGSTRIWFCSVDWHHTYLGKCPNGREKWSFTYG
jgi:hypothetical protein